MIKEIGIFITIPFVLAVPPVLGKFIGDWLDGLFHTEPIFMYVFIALGFVAGFREMYRILRKYGEN